MVKSQLEKPDALGPLFPAFENLLGDLQRHAGDAVGAAKAYQNTKRSAEEMVRAQPDNPDFLIALAWAEACLGEKDAALAHAKRATEARPSSKDAVLGPGYEDALARIQAHFGEKDKAIAALQHLLSISYASPVTPALLRIDPDWDPLRGDPRFEKIVASFAPKLMSGERP